jgi:hypothetical protein
MAAGKIALSCTGVVAALTLWPGAPPVRAQRPDLVELLGKIGERVQQYYERVTSIICIEKVTLQELKYNLTPTGRPRETINELIVVREPKPGGPAEIKIERTLKTVNGRPARQNDRPGCTDPKAVEAEPLVFLLPQHQRKYRFSFVNNGRGGLRDGVAIHYDQIPPDPVDIKWEGNCFTAEGGGATGQVWIDPSTFDVVQLEAGLPKPFRVPLPRSFGSLASYVTVERSDIIIRFGRVNFRDPDESVLLPESMVTVTRFQGVPSLRTTQVFTDYRRFLSEIKIEGAR